MSLCYLGVTFTEATERHPMPRIKLTYRSAKAVRPPTAGQIDYFDQRLPGFALRITEHDHKLWTVLYRHGRRLRRLTLGTYPALFEDI
jgi:hypothetical protein